MPRKKKKEAPKALKQLELDFSVEPAKTEAPKKKAEKAPKKKPAKKSAKKSTKKEPEELGDDLAKIVSTENLEELVRESEAENAAEREKQDLITRQESRYYRGKEMVRQLERQNRSKLILLESLNTERGEWLKMFGNSARFYRFDIGLRIGKKPQVQTDRDWRDKYPGGFVSVRWIDKFIARMAQHQYTDYEYNPEMGIYIFSLNKTYSREDIREFEELAGKQKEAFNRTVRPKNIFPEVWYNMLRLARMLPPKVRKMEPTFREMLGVPLVDDLKNLFVAYMEMANGRTELEEGKRAMLTEVDKLLAGLMILSENERLESADIAKLGEIMGTLKTVINVKIKENNKGEIKEKGGKSGRKTGGEASEK